jgi:hypothetical protein
MIFEALVNDTNHLFSWESRVLLRLHIPPEGIIGLILNCQKTCIVFCYNQISIVVDSGPPENIILSKLDLTVTINEYALDILSPTRSFDQFHIFSHDCYVYCKLFEIYQHLI